MQLNTIPSLAQYVAFIKVATRYSGVSTCYDDMQGSGGRAEVILNIDTKWR